jgi:6-phosphogluconolactonase (cycloisomerase 2 family)
MSLPALNTPPAVHVKAQSGPRHFVFHSNGTLVDVFGELTESISILAHRTPAGSVQPEAGA